MVKRNLKIKIKSRGEKESAFGKIQQKFKESGRTSHRRKAKQCNRTNSNRT